MCRGNNSVFIFGRQIRVFWCIQLKNFADGRMLRSHDIVNFRGRIGVNEEFYDPENIFEMDIIRFFLRVFRTFMFKHVFQRPFIAH